MYQTEYNCDAVEASGSEDLAGKLTAIRDKFLLPTPDKDFTDYAIITRCIAALRPQPSGETRELLERATAIADDVERGKRPKLEAVDMIRELRNALLSVRPLALGGQRGEGWRCPDCGAQADEWFDCCKNPAQAQSDDLRTACQAVLDDYQTSDTHHPDHILIRRTDFDRIKALVEAPVVAQAEAQDEGVAGEASAYRVRMISNDPVEWVLMHPEKALDFLSRKGWESQPLYAHPSPTPAADADRVRIAVEALEATKNRVQEWPIGDYETCMCGSPVASHGMWDGHSPVSQGDHAINMIVEAINETLADLKSTAAKEDNNVSTN